MKKNNGGRPLTYDQKMGEEICFAISTSSDGLKQLCKKNPHWPNQNTIHEWRLKIKEFGDLYARAKQHQIECLVDDILEIADDTLNDYTTNEEGKRVLDNEHIQRSRLRIDTRKWLAAKLAPRIYGERVQNDNNHTIMNHEQWLKSIAPTMENYKG